MGFATLKYQERRGYEKKWRETRSMGVIYTQKRKRLIVKARTEIEAQV